MRSASKNDVGECNPSNHLSENRAIKLHMDHVYLPFLDFLWGKTFISPCTCALAIAGALSLLIKDYAIRRGIYRSVLLMNVANKGPRDLCLETTLQKQPQVKLGPDLA